MFERRRVGRRAAAGLAAWLCAAGARADDGVTRLYLIGDGGEPAPGGEPVLRGLASELGRDPGRSFAVFLGDNVYPRGIVAPEQPEHAESVRRLAAQIDAARDSGARFLFVPGNHDWDHWGKDGWNAVRRQAALVGERGGPRADFQPRDGCPGPAVIDVSAKLRLIALDTQWWLHTGPKPEGEQSACDPATERDVAAALGRAVAEARGAQVVILSHHPPLSGGGHGGHFSWQDHLFPLRAVKGWLWLPLPVVGSIYPLARQGGHFGQDIPATGYRHMLDVLEGALAQTRPLVWAAGHEHSLQVLRGRAVRHVLVSGAGYYGHSKTPTRIAETEFRSGDSGFMRLEVAADGSVRLAVLAVDRAGQVTERYAATLD
jgi:hypothetical protein